MPRSPRATRARVKATADKRIPEQSLSNTDICVPPVQVNSALSPVNMDRKDIEAAVANCLVSDTFIDKIVSKLADRIRAAVEETLSQSLIDARARIDELTEEVSNLKTKLSKAEDRLDIKNDDLEQYQRRNNLRIFGIAEDQREDTDKVVCEILKDKLGIDLAVDRIERSHRVGKLPLPGESGRVRPRPVIVKFLSYRDRREVFNKKKGLKGTGITIREDLTSRRSEILRKAIQLYGAKNVWTLDGRIYFGDGGGSIKVAAALSDLNGSRI